MEREAPSPKAAAARAARRPPPPSQSEALPGAFAASPLQAGQIPSLRPKPSLARIGEPQARHLRPDLSSQGAPWNSPMAYVNMSNLLPELLSCRIVAQDLSDPVPLGSSQGVNVARLEWPLVPDGPSAAGSDTPARREMGAAICATMAGHVGIPPDPRVRPEAGLVAGHTATVLSLCDGGRQRARTAPVPALGAGSGWRGASAAATRDGARSRPLAGRPSVASHFRASREDMRLEALSARVINGSTVRVNQLKRRLSPWPSNPPHPSHRWLDHERGT